MKQVRGEELDKEWIDFESLEYDYMNSGRTGSEQMNKGRGTRSSRNRAHSNKRHSSKTGHSRDRLHSDRYSKEQRRKRRKRKRIIITTVVAVLAVVLTVAIFMSVLRIRTLRAFSGDYKRTIDMTDMIVANAGIWLDDVEGADITPEWIQERTEPILLTTTLSFSPHGLKKGSFTEELDNPSYSECSDKAYALITDCLRELIIKRLTTVGYAETVSDEEADALITEALGMSLDSYIKDAGVSIMPDYNELADELTRTGDYTIRKMTVEWTRDGEDKTDEFRTTGDTLIIVNAGYIYEKK